MIHAACRALDPRQVHITDYFADKAKAMADELGCCCESTNKAAVLAGNYIFMCVKPQVMGGVLAEIAPVVKECLDKGEKKVIVSIAAGLQLAYIKEQLAQCGDALRVVRVMPNTPGGHWQRHVGGCRRLRGGGQNMWRRYGDFIKGRKS